MWSLRGSRKPEKYKDSIPILYVGLCSFLCFSAFSNVTTFFFIYPFFKGVGKKKKVNESMSSYKQVVFGQCKHSCLISQLTQARC